MPYRAVPRATLLLVLLATSTAAAEFDDPTWPCIQRKVERLSVGLMWPEPIEEAPAAPQLQEEIDALADRLVLRRVDIDEARGFVEEFAARNAAGPDVMGRVFTAVFDDLAADRSTIIDGIADYSLQQIALSDSIETARDEMSAIMETDDPDFDRVDALEERIDWDERIYTDRQRALAYVCETPVLLEKRLYAVAQMLQQTASD